MLNSHVLDLQGKVKHFYRSLTVSLLCTHPCDTASTYLLFMTFLTLWSEFSNVMVCKGMKCLSLFEYQNYVNIQLENIYKID